MVVAQIILIIAVLILAARVLALRNTHIGGAWKKLGLVLLAMLMVTSIINPEIVTVIAKAVGIGRGTDLLLYVLFVTFLLYAVAQYVKAQDERDKLFRLARQISLIDAKQRYKKDLDKR